MKKIITLLAIIFSLSAHGQSNYYICPADSVTGWLPLMVQSLNNPNIAPRYNLANTEAIMKFTLALAPNGSGIPYTNAQRLDIVGTAAWSNPSVDTIDSEQRIDLARARGQEITNLWFARIDRNEYDGTWTLGQAANAYNNYQDMFNLIGQGLFRIAYLLIDNGTFAPQGVVTQPMLDVLKAKLLQWETDHPRP